MTTLTPLTSLFRSILLLPILCFCEKQVLSWYDLPILCTSTVWFRLHGELWVVIEMHCVKLSNTVAR